MHLTSKGRTKWWLWFDELTHHQQILHIMTATLWSVYKPDYSPVALHICFSLCLSSSTTEKVSLMGMNPPGQNNKRKQGEEERCWIHFHGTYHCCRGARQMMCMQRDVCACEVKQGGGGLFLSLLSHLIFPPALIFVLLRDPKQFQHRVYIKLNASFCLELDNMF